MKELFSLPANQHKDSSITRNIIVPQAGEDIKCSSKINNEFLSPSNQETENCIFLHAKHATVSEHILISIRTVDTDIILIAMHVIRKLNVVELWMKF